jgi:hypothetical protein
MSRHDRVLASLKSLSEECHERVAFALSALQQELDSASLEKEWE